MVNNKNFRLSIIHFHLTFLPQLTKVRLAQGNKSKNNKENHQYTSHIYQLLMNNRKAAKIKLGASPPPHHNRTSLHEIMTHTKSRKVKY